jgi:hypothetical protein
MTSGRPLALFLCCIWAATCLAQQSLFQSHNGDTSIFLNAPDQVHQLGIISANIGDSNLRFGYLHDNSKKYSFGLDLSGELNSTTAELFNGVTPSKAASVNITEKIRWIGTSRPDASKVQTSGTIPCKLCDDWVILQAGYQRQQLKLVDTSLSPLPSPTDHGFDGYNLRAGYNALVKAGWLGDFLVGTTLGAGRQNNTEDLDSVQVTDTIVSVSNGIERRAISGTNAAFVGNYEKYWAVPVNADGVWYPGMLTGRLGIDLFVRSNLAAKHRFGNPGIGAFFAKPGQPARPIGGITVTYQNGRGRLALVTGWNF